MDFPFNISQDINNGFFGDLLPFGMSKDVAFLLFGSYLNALAASILKFLKSLPLKAKLKVTAFANAWCASPFFTNIYPSGLPSFNINFLSLADLFLILFCS